jgi:hypothetical protein
MAPAPRRQQLVVAVLVRKDHALFVEAFREGRIGGVAATTV